MCFFFFKQKTAYEMRISDGSSDVCSSDLRCRSISVSAIWTALSAAPLRRLSDTHQNTRPFFTVGSRRMRLTYTASSPALSDRKSVVSGKRVSVRLSLGGRRKIKEKIQQSLRGENKDEQK